MYYVFLYASLIVLCFRFKLLYNTLSLCANKEIYIHYKNINKKQQIKCNNKKSRVLVMNLK